MLLNQQRAAEVLQTRGLDALVATTRPNFLYASGYGRTLPFATGSPVAAVVGGDPARLLALVLPRIEAASVVELAGRPERIVLYGQFHFALDGSRQLGERDHSMVELLDTADSAVSFAEGVEAAIVHLGLSAATVGWDDPELGQACQQAFPQLTPVAAQPAWRDIRRVKSPGEIALLRRSAEITEAIEAQLIAACHAGTEWSDLRSHYERATVAAGALPGFWSSGGGPNAAVIVDSSPGTLRRGDLVRFDFGCTYQHYWSDTGRTVAVGEPDRLTRERYQALRNGIEAGWEQVRPGVRPSSLFDTIMSAIHASGFGSYQRHHCGHSIGIDMYDADFVGPGNDDPLRAGMVINLEVPYYEIGWGGLQIEDTLLVTETGFAFLTRADRSLRVQE